MFTFGAGRGTTHQLRWFVSTSLDKIVCVMCMGVKMELLIVLSMITKIIFAFLLGVMIGSIILFIMIRQIDKHF